MSRRRAVNDAPTRTRATTTRPAPSARATAAPSKRDPPTPPAKPRSKRRLLGPFAKVVVVVGILGTTVGLAGVWALHQPFLSVQHVRVIGLRHENAPSVLAASQLASHPAMFNLNSALIEQRLSSFVWIKSVTVTKHWPSSVVLTVRERTPVAVAFDAKHQLHYVDVTGHDLGVAPLGANLPTLVYASATNKSWPFLRAGRSTAFVASQLPRAFSSQVSVISENAAGVVSLRLTTPVSFVLGPPTDLRAKFVSIASVIAHSTLQAGDVVDVSVPGALAVTGPALK